MSKLRSLWLCLFLSLAVVPLGAAVTAARSEEEDLFARAEQSIVSAYSAVRCAEDAGGADISLAVEGLNQAASALARARTLQRQGRTAEAIEAANQAFSLSSNVRENAYRLRELAMSGNAERLRLAVIEWATSVSAIVLLGKLTWGRFARWYDAQVLDMIVVGTGPHEP